MTATCDMQLELTMLADGRYRLKLDITIRRPSPYVALVLDMSDSCGALREAARRLHVLLRKLPRDCTVSIFRLSSNSRLNAEGTDTAACLQDGRLSCLNGWMIDDSWTRQVAPAVF